MIEMAMWFLESLGVQSRLLLNSVGCRNCRPRYIEILQSELGRCVDDLCEDCQRRATANSLRVFDCKVEKCQPSLDKLPVITEHLCADCAAHFGGVKALLDDGGIAYTPIPRLVRGLDYYSRTAFEIVSGELGSQNAIAGGGRYDGLSEALGGPPVDGIGFALGLDRLVMILPAEKVTKLQGRPGLFLAYMGDAAFKKATEIARDLRHRGFSCYIDFSMGTLKSQMRLANKIGAQYALILGDNELARGVASLKNLEDSSQREIAIPDIAACLKPNFQDRME
jgi:histidyl-tRNA synthetase